MSRTFRTQPEKQANSFMAITLDGEQKLTKLIKRDNRVTGLRDHKLHRARTRQQLRTEEAENVTAGKKRRYGDHYGTYEL